MLSFSDTFVFICSQFRVDALTETPPMKFSVSMLTFKVFKMHLDFTPTQTQVRVRGQRVSSTVLKLNCLSGFFCFCTGLISIYLPAVFL